MSDSLVLERESEPRLEARPVEPSGPTGSAVPAPSLAPSVAPVARARARRRLGAVVRLTSTMVVSLLLLAMALLSVGPRFLPYQVLYVRSGSMRPTAPVGSLVVVRRAQAESLGRGDIIAFHRPDSASELVVHRIVRMEHSRDGRVFVTKGDANPEPDPWRVRAEGSGWRYVFSVRGVGYVVGQTQQGSGRLAVLVVCAFGLAALLLVDIWRRPKPVLANA